MTRVFLLAPEAPIFPEGVKTATSAHLVSDRDVRDYLRIGIDSLKPVGRREKTGVYGTIYSSISAFPEASPTPVVCIVYVPSLSSA